MTNVVDLPRVSPRPARSAVTFRSLDNIKSRRLSLQKQNRLLGILRNSYPTDVVPSPKHRINVVLTSSEKQTCQGQDLPNDMESDADKAIRDKINNLRKIRVENAKNMMLRSSSAPTTVQQKEAITPSSSKPCVVRPSSRLYPRSLTAPVARLQRIQTEFLSSVDSDESKASIRNSLGSNDEERRKTAITYAAVMAAIKESKKIVRNAPKSVNSCIKSARKTNIRSKSGISNIAGFGNIHTWKSQTSGSIAGVPGVITIQPRAREDLNSNKKSIVFKGHLFSRQINPLLSPRTNSASITSKHADHIRLQQNRRTSFNKSVATLGQSNNCSSVEEFLHCESAKKFSKSLNFRARLWPECLPSRRHTHSATSPTIKQPHNKSGASCEPPTAACKRKSHASSANNNERTVRFSMDENEVYEYELNEPLRPGLQTTLELRKKLDELSS